MKNLTALVALLAVFTLAICFILIGAISEEIKTRLGIDNSQVGSLASALFFTSLIVQLFVGPLVDKLGHKLLAVAGFVATSAAIFLLAFASSFQTALLACSLLGLGAMCANTVGNTLIPIVLFDGKEPARASNLGNGFVGLAFVLTPLALTYLIQSLKIEYSLALSSVAVLVLLFAGLALLATYPKVSSGYRFSSAVRLLGEAPVLVAGLALVCSGALEVSMNTWIKPLMTEMYGGSQTPNASKYATWALSAFGLALGVGRFLTSTVTNLTAIGGRLIMTLSVIAGLAFVTMVFATSPAVVVAAVLVIGLALAPMYPTILGVTFSQYEPRLYGSIFGIIFAVALLGPTVVPKLIGALSVGAGIQKSLPIAAVIAAVLCGLAWLMGKVALRGRR